jgi:PKHD-type hydroxylase
MMLTIPNLFSSTELQQIHETLEQLSEKFVDGTTTAGWHAKQVKHNTQLAADAPQTAQLREQVATALRNHPLFQIAVRPKVIHSIRFSRYESEMSYGSHTDNAFMGGNHFFRSDMSFTLFLSPPESYDGGELLIDAATGEQSIKLDAGSVFVYPSSTLHEVKPVTQGTRLVAVGWVQSLIRSAEQRELLLDLDTVRRSMFSKDGKTTEFDLLSKTLANLLRMWGE